MSLAQRSHSTVSAPVRVLPALPAPLVQDGATRFRKWLGLFFVQSGFFRFTDLGFRQLLPPLARQSAVASGELAEMACDRRREDKLSITVPIVSPDSKSLVNARALEKIRDGTISEWFEVGFVQPVVRWKRVGRAEVTRKLAECLGKQVTAISGDDFRLNGLGPMLAYCPNPHGFKHSIFFALVEAGLAHSLEKTFEHAASGQFDASKPYFFQMNDAPKFYHNKACRAAAVKWLLNEMKKSTPPKNATELSQDEFQSRGWSGLLKQYSRNLFEALVEAGVGWPLEETLAHSTANKFSEEKLYFWQMKRSSRLHDKQEYRVAITRWAVWKTGKPEDVTEAVFQSLGAASILAYTQHSSYIALVEAGFAHSLEETLAHARSGKFDDSKIYPWQATRTPTFFDYYNEQHRRAVYAWLLHKTRKQASEISSHDFDVLGLEAFRKTRVSDGVMPLDEIRAAA